MLGTPHLLVGAAVGKAIPNYWIVFFLSLILHYFFDMLPHIDQDVKDYPNTKQILLATTETLFGILILYLILSHLDKSLAQLGPSIFGATVSIAPDVLDNATPISKYLHKFTLFKQFHYLHKKIHYRGKGKWWGWGVIVQLIIIGLCVWYLLR